MKIFSSLKDDFTVEQLERLFNSYQVFWQVVFYTLFVLIVFCLIAWVFDDYAKRKYKNTLSKKKQRIIEDYKSVDFFYLIRCKKSKKSNIEKLIDDEIRKGKD